MVNRSYKSYCFLGLGVCLLFSLWMLSNSNLKTELNLEPLATLSHHRDALYQNLEQYQRLGKQPCTSDEYNQGKWVYQNVGLPKHSIDGLSEYAGYHCNWDFPHRCYRRTDPDTEFDRSKSIIDYSWQPDNCMILPFQAKQFSQHLSQNPLLLVGDSITQLMFESMWCLLGQDLAAQQQSTNLSGGHTDMWVSQLVHRDLQQDPETENDITVAYVRSDYLVRLDDFDLIKPNEEEGYQIGVGSNFPWVHAIPRFKYIMINTGPHWHPDLKWGPNKNRQELLASFKIGMQHLFEYLKQHIRSDQIVWIRSTPYGHAQCSQYTAPSEIAVTPTGKKGEYEWDMLEKFDFVMKEWVEQENDARFRFLNVSLSNQRGDAHSMPDGDCLHTCLPGPVDDWNKFLYHEMSVLVSNTSTV